MENLASTIGSLAESVAALVKRNRANTAAILFSCMGSTDLSINEFASPLLDMIDIRYQNNGLVFYINERRVPSKDIISFLKKNYPACIFA